MAGRTTFRGGPHPTVEGAIVPEVALDAAFVDRLSDAVGRPLREAESARVAELVAEGRHLATVARGRATAQDSRRTLAALARLDATEALDALRDVDADTRALIDAARYRLGPDASLAEVATDALDALGSDAGGAPRHDARRRLVRAACGLYAALRAAGQGDAPASPWDALLRGPLPARLGAVDADAERAFVATLVEAVEGRALDRGTLADLLAEPR